MPPGLSKTAEQVGWDSPVKMVRAIIGMYGIHTKRISVVTSKIAGQDHLRYGFVEFCLIWSRATNMSLRILIVPDKFKGSLTARQAADAIARGWRKARPKDSLNLLPMSDGGDGFGEVLSSLIGAQTRTVKTVDAAHRPLPCVWWWQTKTKTAIIESAKVNGLAMLAGKGLHPFQLDTFGLGKVLQAAEKAGAAKCIVGIGGSATNDGGFGLARALDWKFYAPSGEELVEWWQLSALSEIHAPPKTLNLDMVVAVDVRNPLLGPSGCSRIYGPQKGLRPEDFKLAEKCLARLANVMLKQFSIRGADISGAGAAGGLGFGLKVFASAKIESGFNLFAHYARLEKHIKSADLAITAEGAMDKQTAMGKGVGQIARLCARNRVPCIGFAGAVDKSVKRSKLFACVRELTEVVDLKRAKSQAARCLEKLSDDTARAWRSN
jgi:glycerate 2-kinase